MSEEDKEDQSFWDKANIPYKVVVLNEETLQEVNNYRLSKMNLYTIIAATFILLSALFLALFFFTPARKIVPGFGEIEENSEFLKLKAELDTLEQIANNQEIYINSMRTLLSGEGSQDMQALPSPSLKVGADKDITVSSTQLNEIKRTIRLDQLSFVPPVRGTISAAYDYHDKHLGIDIVAAKDTPILATMQGIVVSSDWTMETGHTIIIQHPNDIVSAYKHNSVLLKSSGDRVEAGEAIAIIGNSGELTDGPHLHFELWYEGKHVDPSLYVRL